MTYIGSHGFSQISRIFSKTSRSFFIFFLDVSIKMCIFASIN